jgi:transcriptional regulator with GAF, ATPase, and Fis domain
LDKIDIAGSESLFVAVERVRRQRRRKMELRPGPTVANIEPSVLKKISQLLNSLTRVEDVLDKIMDLFMETLHVERGVMLFFDKDEYRSIDRNMERELIEGVRSQFSKSAVAEMRRAGNIIVVDDVTKDERFRDSKSVEKNRIRSLLCVPVRVMGEVFGAIYVDHRKETKIFTPRELDFIEALSNLAAIAIEKARLYGELGSECRQLKNTISKYLYKDIIGTSSPMQELFGMLDKIARSPHPETILIEGEMGTGKTSIVKLIHRQGPRKSRPLVTFSGANVQETLVESELFGHKRGSFTGATDDRQGLIEQADGGTLFLDDVNTLPPLIQAKFLHFLQEKEIRPLGGNVKKLDVHVICASNEELKALVKKGDFRQDLYYRLNVVVLNVPPLRERKEDIPLLARHFLEQSCRETGKEIKGFAPEVVGRMMNYSWPGNVRELENEIKYCVMFSENPYIALGDLKTPELKSLPRKEMKDLRLDKAIGLLTAEILSEALAKHDGNISRASKEVGVSRGTFYDLMTKHHLDNDGKKAKAKK